MSGWGNCRRNSMVARSVPGNGKWSSVTGHGMNTGQSQKEDLGQIQKTPGLPLKERN